MNYRKSVLWFVSLVLIFGYLLWATAFFNPLSEASGLVASRQHPGLFWALNDSGSDPILYAITKDRTLKFALRIVDAENVDWESVSIDETDHLLVLDSGNNQNKRKDLRVLRVPEPLTPPHQYVELQTEAEVFGFDYPEQTKFPDEQAFNFDAEASFYRAGTTERPGRLYILTKHRSDTQTVLYAFPALNEPGHVQPKAVDTFDVGGAEFWFGGRVTGADLHPDGEKLAVLTYHRLFVFAIAGEPAQLGEPIASVDFVQRRTQQVEAVAWSGEDLLILNEQGDVFVVPAHTWRQPGGVFPK